MLMHYTAVAVALAAQAIPGKTPATLTAPAQATQPHANGLTLRQDTPVELMAVAEINTDKAQPGDLIRFRVNHAIEIDGRIAVPVGTPAFGEVTTAKDAGGLGKTGRMTAKLLRIQFGEIEIPLEGEMAAKGTGAGSAGVAILLTGIAGLFHRGNNAKIKAGEIVAGFVGKDVVLASSSSAR